MAAFRTTFTILIVFAIRISLSAQDSGKITIEVVGLKNTEGTVRVGIYNKEQDYLEDAGVIKRLSCKIQENKCIMQSEKLPYGEYAFALLHDENNNETMDYNFIKIPKEGFGFSNNPSIRMSAPSFQETKVKLDETEKKITIKVKYM